MLDRMDAVGMGEGAGVPKFAITQVIKGHDFREAGVEPGGGLIDDSNVTLGWVGVGHQKLESGVLPQ
jgi:hypothetical protein